MRNVIKAFFFLLQGLGGNREQRNIVQCTMNDGILFKNKTKTGMYLCDVVDTIWLTWSLIIEFSSLQVREEGKEARSSADIETVRQTKANCISLYTAHPYLPIKTAAW